MLASQNGHVGVVNELLQHGASVDVQSKVKLQLLRLMTFLHFVDARV